MSRRLLPAAVCVVALLAAAVQTTRAAEPAASKQQAGRKALVLNQKTGGAAQPTSISTAAVARPAAYRNKDDLPEPYRAQKPLTAYTDPAYESYYQHDPSIAYPNANPGYQPRPYQDPGYGTAHGYHLEEPVKGYAHSPYSSPTHNPLQYSAIAPYQPSYAATPAYQGAYQSSSHELYAPASYGSRDAYWHSFQSAPTYTSTGPYYGSDHPAYSHALGSYDVKNQQPLRGVYRSHQGAYSLATQQPTRAHHPTMAHQEDPYAAQQQALTALGLPTTTTSPSTLGGSYAALYSKQAALTGGSYNKAADPISEQWWKDHQQLQPTSSQSATGDKLDALLTLINKLAP